ncbi:MAG TPA: helix-turn-helix domain-containing protein [Rectinemataceae bacterium]|nr:helix-turn-helix domain-containing protein [Rectinemataceae bacterium]
MASPIKRPFDTRLAQGWYSANRKSTLRSLGGESNTGASNSGDLVIDTEYAILLLLARNPGRVYSREEIFEAVRGEGTYGEVSTVTVHMRRLREKIEADPSNSKHIETVWGKVDDIRKIDTLHHLAIDFSSMPYSKNQHQYQFVFDSTQYPIISHSIPPQLS